VQTEGDRIQQQQERNPGVPARCMAHLWVEKTRARRFDAAQNWAQVVFALGPVVA
jgi:hypothetical protein